MSNKSETSNKEMTRRLNNRYLMDVLLIFSDSASLFLSGFIALHLWTFVRSDLNPSLYQSIIPLILLFIIVYSLVGLYSGGGINPYDELRRLTISTTAVFLALGTMSFWIRNVEMYSRASFALAWAIAVIAIPAARHIVRSLAARCGLWGEPIVLIGYGEKGARIFNMLKKNPKLGYMPEVIIQAGSLEVDRPENVRLFSDDDIPSIQSAISGLSTAIVVTSDIPERFLKAITRDHIFHIPHMIMINPDQQLSNIWFTPKDIGGMIGLEIHQNLLNRSQQIIKRVMDLGIILVSSPIMILVFLLIAFMIAIDSRGPIFYRQKRIGHQGKDIRIWKFRTMVPNAENILSKYLADNPDHLKEWEETTKIKNDPRITRIGKFLRRFSLDELPQLLNVLEGEMSLVGPRPIVSKEIQQYADDYKTYIQVKPGLTGLWQVSGRNDLSYQQRVRLDRYYVQNWSIWLDLFIIVKTIFTVFSGKGAY